MTYVEQLLGEQGRANRSLGEELLHRQHLEAMHTAATQPRPRMNVYGSTCPLCCGDVADAAFVKTGASSCPFCRNKELAAEQSRSRWISLEVASAAASGSGKVLTQRPQIDNR
jgi:hypothetical protein